MEDQNRVNVLVVANALGEISVSGKANMEKLLACIKLLEQTAESMKETKKVEENA